ncbi:MAG: hypothetical protein KA270_03325 [Saprospiraceae bacterium]|nr:hypothetical protein [Saprospiraceae bacterium]
MILINVAIPGLLHDFNISRLKYVLDFIANHPSSPGVVKFSINEKNGEENIKVYYSDVGFNKINWVKPINIFFKKNFKPIKPIAQTKLSINDLELTGFCADGSPESMPFDVFETIFFHISRYEEWFCADHERDIHGTMSSTAQYLVKNKLYHIPVVDHLVYFFYSSIGLSPNKRTTTYSLTHDVDFIKKFSSYYKFLLGYGNILIYQKNKIQNIIHHTRHFFQVKAGKIKDTYDTFHWLLVGNDRISQRVIYLLSGGQTKYEGFFDIKSTYVKKLIEKAKEKGYQIGLHPSYNSMNNLSIIQAERDVLSEIVKEDIELSRQHYLRFDLSVTAKILELAGIKSDSSLGYRDLIGFRCGTGYPYHLYDFENEKAFEFVEVPLIVMDVAGMRECGWDSSLWIKLISEFISENSHYTHITFNFHNSFFDPVVVDVALLKRWYLQQFGP